MANLTSRQQFGKKGESLAADCLIKNGYRILTQNYRTRQGEIDIIAQEGDTIVFVEVKARRSNRFGSPKEAVTLQKQKKISASALDYLKAANQSNAKARFDVVAICSDKNCPSIEIIKNAFQFVG
jgi:putative endonuclease